MIYSTQSASKVNEPPMRTLKNETSKEISNYNNFIKLFTTELKNQDPLKPLDSNQLVDQLATFSIVEQAIKTNEYLSKLVEISSNNELISPAGRSISSDQ